jgi:hypothetical protein
MTRLYLVSQGDRRIWVAALIDNDVWTYVTNTGRFHRNEGVGDDFFMRNVADYTEIGITEARRMIEAGVGTVDEEKDRDSVQEWRGDREAMDADTVFASLAADLA